MSCGPARDAVRRDVRLYRCRGRACENHYRNAAVRGSARALGGAWRAACQRRVRPVPGRRGKDATRRHILVTAVTAAAAALAALAPVSAAPAGAAAGATRAV